MKTLIGLHTQRGRERYTKQGLKFIFNTLTLTSPKTLRINLEELGNRYNTAQCHPEVTFSKAQIDFSSILQCTGTKNNKTSYPSHCVDLRLFKALYTVKEILNATAFTYQFAVGI